MRNKKELIKEAYNRIIESKYFMPCMFIYYYTFKNNKYEGKSKITKTDNLMDVLKEISEYDNFIFFAANKESDEVNKALIKGMFNWSFNNARWSDKMI